ncbi:MAG: 30S ribosomal protein S15, partial [Proteobacteria bacterium]|nr:30S ribosomal protein S15 [Pseudomonadota bacterium]
MALLANEKEKIVGKFQRTDNDTGSPEVQIALLT